MLHQSPRVRGNHRITDAVEDGPKLFLSISLLPLRPVKVLIHPGLSMPVAIGSRTGCQKDEECGKDSDYRPAIMGLGQNFARIDLVHHEPGHLGNGAQIGQHLNSTVILSLEHALLAQGCLTAGSSREVRGWRRDNALLGC